MDRDFQTILHNNVEHACIPGYKPGSSPYKLVHVQEAETVKEIFDANHVLCYSVKLEPYNASNELYDELCRGYRIIVSKHFNVEAPLVIAVRPDFNCDEHPIFDLAEATALFNQVVAKYSMLVKATSADYQCIDIFKDKIGYRECDPKMCQSCKWCQPAGCKDDYVFGVSGKLECHNPENVRHYDFDVGQFIPPPCPPHHHGPHSPIYCPPPRDHFSRKGIGHSNDHCWHEIIKKHPQPPVTDVFPRVSPWGKCDFWEKRGPSFKPHHGQHVEDFVNAAIKHALINIVPKIVDNKIGNITENEELQSQIAQQIENATSGLLTPEQADQIKTSIEAVTNEVAEVQTSLSQKADSVDVQGIQQSIQTVEETLSQKANSSDIQEIQTSILDVTSQLDSKVSDDELENKISESVSGIVEDSIAAKTESLATDIEASVTSKFEGTIEEKAKEAVEAAFEDNSLEIDGNQEVADYDNDNIVTDEEKEKYDR